MLGDNLPQVRQFSVKLRSYFYKNGVRSNTDCKLCKKQEILTLPALTVLSYLLTFMLRHPCVIVSQCRIVITSCRRWITISLRIWSEIFTFAVYLRIGCNCRSCISLMVDCSWLSNGYDCDIMVTLFMISACVRMRVAVVLPIWLVAITNSCNCDTVNKIKSTHWFFKIWVPQQ